LIHQYVAGWPDFSEQLSLIWSLTGWLIARLSETLAAGEHGWRCRRAGGVLVLHQQQGSDSPGAACINNCGH